MITDKVINEIYRRFRKPPKDIESLRLPEIMDILKKHHNISFNGKELVFEDLDEFNPFRMMLARRLLAVMEFDRFVAFVLPSHILFLSKNDNAARVRMRPESQENILQRIFARG